MPKIKVLHILYSFGIGGMEKGLAMLVQNASEDFEHVILCMARSGDSAKLLPPSTRVIELGKSAGSSFSFIYTLAKAIRKEQPNIVHTRNWGGMDGIIASRLAGITNVVHGEHGWGMDDPQGRNKKRLLIRRLLSLGVKEFTAVSQQMKSWLDNEVRVFRPVTQIYNGVDTSETEVTYDYQSIKQELNLSSSSFLLGTVGRLDRIKDHAGLIESFKDLRKTVPDCHLVIVGDGPERETLESVSGDGIHFLGMRSNVMQILQSLDVFVLPSLNEGISNTLLEAMASRLPVVATAVGGTPELIEDGKNGLLVQPRDYYALADSLKRYLFDDDLREQHGREGRRFIEEKYSIPAMVRGYEDVWKRVAG